MTGIQTPEELLAHLAARGDPTAFATLVGSRARAAYTSLRNAGKSHADATTVLLGFFRKAHTALQENRGMFPLTNGTTARVKNLLPRGVNIGERNRGRAVARRVPGGRHVRFDSQVRLALQRNYGGMLRSGGAAAGGIVSFVNARSLMKAGATALITLAATAAGLYCWMIFAHASVTVIVSKAGRHSSVELPLAINRRLFPSRPVVNPPDSHVVKSENAALPADSQHPVHAGPAVAGDSLPAQKPVGKTISERLSAGNPAPLAGKRRLPARKRVAVPADSLGAAGGSMGTPSSSGEIKKNLSQPAEPALSSPVQGGTPSSSADTSAAGK